MLAMTSQEKTHFICRSSFLTRRGEKATIGLFRALTRMLMKMISAVRKSDSPMDGRKPVSRLSPYLDPEERFLGEYYRMQLQNE